MRAFRRAPKGGALACLFGTLVSASACGLNQEGVAPPRDRIGFPGSIKADPDGSWLYVVNSNADLRFNSGTVVAVNLDQAASDRDRNRADEWPVCPRADYLPPADAPPLCCWDFLDHNILDCDDRRYIDPATTIAIGSFGAGSAFQSFSDKLPVCPTASPNAPTSRHDCNPPCGANVPDGRLYIGVRGNSSITYVDTTHAPDGHPVLSCPQANATTPGTAKDCAVKNDMEPVDATPIVLPDEPYTLQLDPSRDLLYVGHLRNDLTRADSGGISLFDIAKASTGVPPAFLRSSGKLFPADTNGNAGVTSLSMTRGRLYATSRFVPMGTRVATPEPGLSCIDPTPLDRFSVAPSSETYVSPLLGAEGRGIQFLPPRKPVGAPPTPGRAFLLQRTPPAVVTFDAAMGEDGVFGNFPSEVIEVCQAPTFLQKDRTDEEEVQGFDDAMLYVTCFDQGQVYVIDPRVPRLVGIIDVGRGPAGLEFPPRKGSERFAYVVGFGSNNVGVIDLTDGSPTQYHVIQRIGFPSVVPR